MQTTHKNDLFKIALIGTSQSGELPELPAELSALATKNSEEKVLMMAALAAMQEKVAYELETFEGELPEACEDEQPNYMRQQAVELLVILMSTTNSQPLVQEFLEKMIQLNKIIRPNLLPQLFVYGKNRKELHPLIAKVIGNRGFWLANANADWSYIKKQATSLQSSDWEDGSHLQRVAYLHLLRKKNPAEAREILIQTWAKEGLAQKVDFLDIFGEQLSTEDEPFLNELLGEKSKEIRSVVMRYLCQIPNSELQERMKTRLEKMLNTKQDSKKTIQIELELPEKCTPEMEKDGIDAKSKGFQSVKAGWVAQLLLCVPPNRIFDINAYKIEDYLAALLKSEWANVLIPTLADSALLHQNQDWQIALLDLWLKEKTDSHINREKSMALINQLSVENYTKWIQLLVNQKVEDKKLMEALAFRKQAWQKEVSDIALNLLTNAVDTYKTKQPFHCPELLAFVQQTVLSATEQSLPYFTQIFGQFQNHNANWTKEMHNHIQQMQLRMRIFAEASYN